MKISIKKTLLALALSGLAISPLQAKNDESNVQEVRDEVSIMLNILQASLKQQESKKNVRFRADSVFYLANQGVVFDIGSNRRGGNIFRFNLGGLNGLIDDIPEVPDLSDSNKFEFNINENEIERMVMRFTGHGEDFDDEFNDKLHDLKEEQRELNWEKREYERSSRDLEFEKRNADSERRKKIEKEVAQLQKEVVKLQSKSAEIEKFRKELEVERTQELAKHQAVKKKLYKESLALFEDTIGDVLCRYGAGLRSLADDENISFILSDFVEADNNRDFNSHDKVYVFKHKDVQACVSGKSDKNKLLASANTYLF